MTLPVLGSSETTLQLDALASRLALLEGFQLRACELTIALNLAVQNPTPDAVERLQRGLTDLLAWGRAEIDRINAEMEPFLGLITSKPAGSA